MSRIIDRRSEALGRTDARTRQESAIRRIGIHHSVTPPGHTTSNFENWWRDPRAGMGDPPVGGYHEAILQNGDVELNFNPTQISHGVGNQNADSYHICVVGNFRVNGAQPNAAQSRVLLERIRFNVNRFANVTFDRVLGHNEFPGHTGTVCPGMNMTTLRSQARQGAPAPAPPTAPVQQAGTHVIARGETLWSLARAWNTTVAAIESANPGVNPSRLQVGQRIQRPGGTANHPATNNGLRVGSRVRVNADAHRWVTGQNLPAKVRGGLYEVQQIGRNGNNNHILIGRDNVATGWIERHHLTLM